MKGIVAEINGKHAVVLTQEGLFQRVKATSDMEVGKEIDLSIPAEKTKQAGAIAKVASLAAAGLLILGIGLGAYSYTVPYSYVHLDINPSVELTANIYDRIIMAEALNPDGEVLLSENDLKNERVDTAIIRLINAAMQQGYLSNASASPTNSDTMIQGVQADPEAEAELEVGAEAGAGVDKPESIIDESVESESKASDITNPVLITVSSKNKKKSDALKKEITNAASEKLDKDMVEPRMLVAQTSVEQCNEARKQGVSPGKLVLIEDAMEGRPSLELDKLKEKAIRDLLEMAADKRKEDTKRTEKGENKKAEKHSRKEAAETDRNDVIKTEETKAIADKATNWGTWIQKNNKDERDQKIQKEREEREAQKNQKEQREREEREAQKNQKEQKEREEQEARKNQKGQKDREDLKSQKNQRIQKNQKDQNDKEDRMFHKDQKNQKEQKAQKDQEEQNSLKGQKDQRNQKNQKEHKNQKLPDKDQALKREREQLKNELIKQINDKTVYKDRRNKMG